MMSIRKALEELLLIVEIHQKDTKNNFEWAAVDYAKELLAQPEQEPNQNMISDIEYLITAFEDGADADDYWLNISDLRDELVTLKGQVPVRQILEAFPLLDEEGLDQEKHHCEWVLQQDRKRLHAMLFNPLQLLAQPEPELTAPPKREAMTGKEISQGFRADKDASNAESYWAGVALAEKAHGIGVDDET